MSDILEQINASLANINNLAATFYKSILTTEEACKFTGLPMSSILKKTSAQEITHYKAGNKVYFKKDDLERWMLKNRIATKEELNSSADTYISINKR